MYGDVDFIDCSGIQVFPYRFPLAYAVKLTAFDLFSKTALFLSKLLYGLGDCTTMVLFV